MWRVNNTGHTEGMEVAPSTGQVANSGPTEKRQKGRVRSGPTNANNQRRTGTRFSNNPNLQTPHHHHMPAHPPHPSQIAGASMGGGGSVPPPIQTSTSSSMGISGMGPPPMGSMGVPGNIMGAQPVVSQQPQGQVTSYRHTKKIPIDRSKFHPSISNLAGAIIGVSGSNQKWMEQESGAQVQILGTTGNDPEGLHILVRYNEPRELEIVESIIEEIGRATFEGGGGFVSHILPSRKPASPNLTTGGMQGSMAVSGVVQDYASNAEKQMLGNGMMAIGGGGTGGVMSMPIYYSLPQNYYNSVLEYTRMDSVQKARATMPFQVDWPSTPPTTPIEFEWLLHLVLHSSVGRFCHLVGHGVPMVHIPLLYNSLTSFRFEHDAISFFQSYIIQSGLFGLIEALPHVFIEGPYTLVDCSNFPAISPIFKVDTVACVSPLLLPAQPINVSYADFKLTAESYWIMGMLPATFLRNDCSSLEAGPVEDTSDHVGSTVRLALQGQQHSGNYQDGGGFPESSGRGSEGCEPVSGASTSSSVGRFSGGEQGMRDSFNDGSAKLKRGHFLASDADEDDQGLYTADKANSKNGTANSGISSMALSSHSSTTTTTSSGTTSSSGFGKDNIPQTPLMIVLQGVHFLLRRWVNKKWAPHYTPKNSLDFLPLDILETEFFRFYQIPLNIEALGWTNLLHFVEAFPDVWTVENVGPDEFTMIPLPYPDFSMIAKTRGISRPGHEGLCCPGPESVATLRVPPPQHELLANIGKNGGCNMSSFKIIAKQTQDFIAEAIASGFPVNYAEINSINEIINGVMLGIYSLDSNTGLSLYELISRVSNAIPSVSFSRPVLDSAAAGTATAMTEAAPAPSVAGATTSMVEAASASGTTTEAAAAVAGTTTSATTAGGGGVLGGGLLSPPPSETGSANGSSKVIKSGGFQQKQNRQRQKQQQQRQQQQRQQRQQKQQKQQQKQTSQSSGHASIADETSSMGQGHHISQSAVLPVSNHTSRFNSMNSGNGIRYDIGAAVQQPVSSVHSQHNAPHHHQNNAQAVNGSNSIARPANGGQPKRGFSNQCGGNGGSNVASGGGHGRQLPAGQEQRLYQVYDQQGISQSEFMNLQHVPPHFIHGQNAFLLQGGDGVNSVHNYYHHHSMDGSLQPPPHFATYNGVVSDVGNVVPGSCHYDYHSFGTQPANAAGFVQQQPSHGHGMSAAHFSNAMVVGGGVPPGQAFGGGNVGSSNNPAGATSRRSSCWDRKNKSKNN